MSKYLSYRRLPSISETPMDDETFLVDPSVEGIFHLNPVGKALWVLLEQPQRADEIKALLAVAFPEAPETTLRADIDKFLEALIEAKLIETIKP
ncbi:MAG: PqqD family protein [Rhodospirillales bacterium]|jgi:hypothetical protein|nr:PqqD family protein [Rhodospirillales bacterium]MBT4005956.1 PqqD family protein [Rhodospirillales bacterium]MBT5076150.1 PqqD family protein [Rhodospirillales bacterium]MBT5114175.1 PqqD family protein [Rhodospirillales bacterium]MBT5673236.1 PqqD family protein [Rhodospirillales bacterium]